MAEKKESVKNSNKALRSYLVYDYIFKKVENSGIDSFTTTQINEYLQMYGVYCDNRSIVRDIEAINQAYILVKEELDSVEEANELLLDESNQLVSRATIYSNSYHINQEKHSWRDWLMIAECISAARFVNEKETERLITLLGRCLHPDELKEINKKVSRIQREKIEAKFLQRNLNKIYNTLYWENYFGKICECREKLSFYYITYSIDRLGKPFEKQLKEYCTVHPHKIVNHNGLHYLVAYDDTKRKMRAFRIDRMEVPRQMQEQTSTTSLRRSRKASRSSTSSSRQTLRAPQRQSSSRLRRSQTRKFEFASSTPQPAVSPRATLCSRLHRTPSSSASTPVPTVPLSIPQSARALISAPTASSMTASTRSPRL